MYIGQIDYQVLGQLSKLLNKLCFRIGKIKQQIISAMNDKGGKYNGKRK